MTSAATPSGFSPEAFDGLLCGGDLTRLGRAVAGLDAGQLQMLIDRAEVIRAETVMEYRILGILARGTENTWPDDR
ncbi:hypothetical protein LO772_00075 [Yinghuangia sp. ASG 101]|uniref:hypothetical protein n=1 Tax=Yinghuangia sp. ASG 101 TaxID=2896848 RepID=UPI001E3520FD|nr:hypothetical protein [Yinghuangia sp. ASG 101]UGQ12051.1 hypothetical protein LO772_00075 [Yinghuangia sp. ASG 101]